MPIWPNINRMNKLKKLLLETGYAKLAKQVQEKDATNPSSWTGKNGMGEILMEVRKRLK